MDKPMSLLIAVIIVVSFIGAVWLLCWFQRRKKAGRSIWLSLFLGIFSMIFMALGIGMIYASQMQEKTCSALTEGEIVEYRVSHHKNKYKYSPVVRFEADGEVILGETKVWMNHKPFHIGEGVTVNYNPGKPTQFYMKEYDLKTQYHLGILFLFVSIAILFVAAIFAILKRMKMNEQKKENIRVFMIVGGIVLFIFLGFWFTLGPAIAFGLFAAMGLFALYAFYDNKRKEKHKNT